MGVNGWRERAARLAARNERARQRRIVGAVAAGTERLLREQEHATTGSGDEYGRRRRRLWAGETVAAVARTGGARGPRDPPGRARVRAARGRARGERIAEWACAARVPTFATAIGRGCVARSGAEVGPVCNAEPWRLRANAVGASWRDAGASAGAGWASLRSVSSAGTRMRTERCAL